MKDFPICHIYTGIPADHGGTTFGLVYWKATMGNQQKMRIQQVIRSMIFHQQKQVNRSAHIFH